MKFRNFLKREILNFQKIAPSSGENVRFLTWSGEQRAYIVGSFILTASVNVIFVN